MNEGAIAVLVYTADSQLDRALRDAAARRGLALAAGGARSGPILAVVDFRDASAPDHVRALREAAGGSPVHLLALVVAQPAVAGLDAMLAAGADDVLLTAPAPDPAQLDARLAVGAQRLAGLAQAAAAARALQTRLATAERMAAVGMLAASVAHEVNNPLAYVISNLAFATERLRDLVAREAPARLDEARQALDEAREGADRVRAIVHDLRRLARAGVDVIDAGDRDGAVADVHRALESSIAMTRAELEPRARLVRRFARGVPPVRADASRLGQVFMNLLVNAAQALPPDEAERQTITVSTDFDAARRRVVVEVADTGPGIPPALLARVFEPFFTTKPPGTGLGLGLPICQRIVAALGGEITAANAPVGGAVFRVELVAAEATAALEPAAANGARTDASSPSSSSSSAVAGRPRRRVLVIDDEPLVARAVRRTLDGEHDVVTVGSAREALARLVEGETFDVILCDLVMPAMNGRDFYNELTRVLPAMGSRVVFLSGEVPSGTAYEFVQRSGVRCLSKPFDPASLRAAVRELAGG